jgi:DNA-binding IclR family transcriptional regulator
MSIEAFVGGTVGRVEALPINLQSISEFTGIPRETVRRKLEILIQKGWIKRDNRKYMTATDEANQAFIGLTRITQKYLRDLASAMNRSS